MKRHTCYLVPASQFLRVRDFDSAADARTWAHEFNQSNEQEELVAITDATDQLRLLAIDMRSKTRKAVALVADTPADVGYQTNSPEKAQQFADQWNRTEADDETGLHAVVVHKV